MTQAHAMTAAVDAIRDMREELLRAGFRHANGAGELVSADDTTWVSTTYTHGEYSVYAWRRPRGYGEIAEQRWVMRVFPHTDPADVKALTTRLKRWAKRPPKNGRWPLVGLATVR